MVCFLLQIPLSITDVHQKKRSRLIMANKNKIMTEDEAQMLEKTHRQVWEALDGKKNYNGILGAVTTIGSFVNKFKKFIGPVGQITGAVDILWGISQKSNNAATISYFRGAELQFDAVRNLIRRGGYRAAEVQMNWITYPQVSRACEFVQGNEGNPAVGYKIIRLQRSNGSWFTPPMGS
jgi:hypothetical protein